jgi:two-component system, LytTR family, response regulator
VKIRTVVVDDEPLARAGIMLRLSSFEDVEVVGGCATGEEALAAVPILRPELMFLDVQMPGMSGFDVLRNLPAQYHPTTIFLTAHEEYALAAFDVHAAGYLLKPIDDERFLAAFLHARGIIESRTQSAAHLTALKQLIEQTNPQPSTQQRGLRFVARTAGKMVFISEESVDWIEAVGDYAGLHVGKQTHLIRESLQSLETQLDASTFVRIHRSAIVKVDRITQMQPLKNRDCLIWLKDGRSLRVSRTFNERLIVSLKIGNKK